MARTQNAKNKLNLRNEAKRVKNHLDGAIDSATTAEENKDLLRIGAGISLTTLIRAAAGDQSLAGISTTNMVSAADKLLTMYIKVFGAGAFNTLLGNALEGELTEEQKANLEAEDDSSDKSASIPDNLSFIGRFQQK